MSVRPTSRRRHGHRRVILGSVTVIGLVGVLAARQLLPSRGTSTPITVEDATEAFADTADTADTASGPSTTATSLAPSVTLPAPGVYVYATTGRDEVDALNGDHHDYPTTTTITVRTSSCGVSQRWDILEERWEQWERCASGDGVAERARTSYDSFFGRSQTDTYSCTGDPRPVDAPAGSEWIVQCVQGGAIDTYTGTVIGPETLLVGATAVETVHVQVVITGPEATDTQSIDSWYQVGADLLIAQQGSSRTSNPSPIGTVHYTEDYEIHLTALQPVR